MSDDRKSICRVVHKKDYTVVNNHICRDNSISYKAKGIWLYAFSRPDDWQFYLFDIINHSSDGRDSVRSGIIELEKAGYLTREKMKNEKGKYCSYVYTFYEIPIEVKTEFPETENPTAEIKKTENHPLSSTEAKPSTNPPITESSSSKPSSCDSPSIDDDDVEKDSIQFTRTNGKEDRITQSEVYKYFLGKPYSTETIKESIRRFRDVVGPVNNVLRYLEETCNSIDSPKPAKNTKKPEKQEKRPEKPKTQEETITFEEYFKCTNQPNPFHWARP